MSIIQTQTLKHRDTGTYRDVCAVCVCLVSYLSRWLAEHRKLGLVFDIERCTTLQQHVVLDIRVPVLFEEVRQSGGHRGTPLIVLILTVAENVKFK